MADRDKDIRLFQRAATARLAAAEFLLQHDFHLDAVYLAGYSIECALKALTLRRTPRGGHVTAMEELTQAGAKGHDFEYLKGILKARMKKEDAGDREAFGKIKETLRVVSSWSTDLRYQMMSMKPGNAKRFVEAAQEICDWCRRS